MFFLFFGLVHPYTHVGFFVGELLPKSESQLVASNGTCLSTEASLISWNMALKQKLLHYKRPSKSTLKGKSVNQCKSMFQSFVCVFFLQLQSSFYQLHISTTLEFATINPQCVGFFRLNSFCSYARRQTSQTGLSDSENAHGVLENGWFISWKTLLKFKIHDLGGKKPLFLVQHPHVLLNLNSQLVISW